MIIDERSSSDSRKRLSMRKKITETRKKWQTDIENTV